MVQRDKNKVYTRGGICIEDIQVNDIHYEFEYGLGIKCKVISKPVLEDNMWTWQSENLISGEIINYLSINQNTPYGLNLYDHEAYGGVKYI